jgi:hypothetical protein
MSWVADDPLPADPFVIEAFDDVLLAKRTRKRDPSKIKIMNELERTAWQFLCDYLATLERPRLAPDPDIVPLERQQPTFVRRAQSTRRATGHPRAL